MRPHRLQRWLTVGAMLALPVLAHAQEATLSGTVSDTTGGALPGVTVRAVHEASGNSFDAVTDERGGFRLPVRVGTYRVTAELGGFAPVTRAVTLLVGQQAVVNLQMGVSGVQESVTVTGEAPLLDVTQSSLGGNVDPRQLQELPVNGRNWIDLVMLAPGARVNAVVEAPSTFGDVQGGKGGSDFQINVDGQQVTNQISGSSGDGQPRFSRDAIAEFEFLSSRFDATQGRSAGTQINAITKSGTNTPSGSFSGYFRDDRFNAADFVAKDAAGKPRVLPYQDQQLSGTFGGPIRKDKVHFFVNDEYEREPSTFVFTTPYPAFNRDVSLVRTEKKAGVRLDAQVSPRTRLTVRGSTYELNVPKRIGSGTLATTTPAGLGSRFKSANQIMSTLTQVLSNRVVNEVKLGYASFFGNSVPLRRNPNAKFNGIGGPRIQLKGLIIGEGFYSYPNDQGSDIYSGRDDLTYSFAKGGRHTVKLGAEYLYQKVYDHNCVGCEGLLTADVGSVPTNIESLFPDLLDVSTWNLAPLSPISIRWREAFVRTGYPSHIPRYVSAFWVQDDWTISPRLTLNLGLRYDLELNAFANDLQLPDLLPGNRPNDTNNLGPRLGGSFSANDRTVVRGGYGLYYATITNAHILEFATKSIDVTVLNTDGRPDFASNPWNGPAPTYESLAAKVCTAAAPLAPGCIRRDIPNSGTMPAPGFVMPYSHQASIGLQRQLGTTMAIEADYIYIGNRKGQHEVLNNLRYDPVTGANYPFRTFPISERPYPSWGSTSLAFNGRTTNYHALQTAFTKRFSGGWQASGTYTLGALRDKYPQPRSGLEVVPFKVAPDLGNEYTLAIGDQRHRAVVNGIWQLRYGFQLSGLYFFGSGERYETRYGADLRNLGNTTRGEQRLRPDGTIVPRNNLVGKPIHRVDLRLQRRFPLGGHAGIDGLLEVFNVFNHANYGSYVTQENSTRYGQPAQNATAAYAPRILQLGFRVAF